LPLALISFESAGSGLFSFFFGLELNPAPFAGYASLYVYLALDFELFDFTPFLACWSMELRLWFLGRLLAWASKRLAYLILSSLLALKFSLYDFSLSRCDFSCLLFWDSILWIRRPCRKF
jgi:hypothetical protein